MRRLQNSLVKRVELSSVQFSSVPMAGTSLYLVFWKSIHLNAMQCNGVDDDDHLCIGFHT
jgi:hypothetical protein